MQLIYEGTDITKDVDIVSCIHRDVSGGRCDSMEIELEHADAWFRWKPQRNDAIEAMLDEYRTGKLYLNTIRPENGKFRIIATGMPAGTQRKMYAGYENMRLGDIAEACAAECGMQSALFGLSGNITYPFVMRNNEGPIAFLSRLLSYEGAVLKTLNGRLTAISIDYAQNLDPLPTAELPSDQKGAIYTRRDDIKIKRITIRTPYADASCEDNTVTGDVENIYTDIPARDSATAGRWARGLLLTHNRRAERFTFQTTFNPAATAMTRMDVRSAASFDGEWLIDEVTHDLWRGRSEIGLLRCIRTIG